MKKPQKPPATSFGAALVYLTHSTHLSEFIANATVEGKYLHWDELRHLDPPEGLSHKQWWAILKFARRAGRQLVNLEPIDGGHDFSFILPDIAQQYLYELSKGLGGSIELSSRVVNKDTRDQYYISSLVDEAITSSQLEGASTTKRVAEDMLRSGRSPRSKSELMIFNNYRAMNLVGEMKDKPLTPARVFELHRVVTEGTLRSDDEAGRFRRPAEQIEVVNNENDEILHVPPHADTLPVRLQRMCDFANEKTPEGKFIHPIVRAIILHFWLAYDHPFTDGNGRVARALFYWSMRRAGHWLAEYVSISTVISKAPAKYGRAFLYTESDDNDLTYFILYHLRVLSLATRNLHDYIQRKSARVRKLTEQLNGLAALNHRQRELIIHALRHPRQEYTIQSHRTSHNVVYQTARRDLLDLEERGYLIRMKRGKEFVFMAQTGLEKKLERRT